MNSSRLKDTVDGGDRGHQQQHQQQSDENDDYDQKADNDNRENGEDNKVDDEDDDNIGDNLNDQIRHQSLEQGIDVLVQGIDEFDEDNTARGRTADRTTILDSPKTARRKAKELDELFNNTSNNTSAPGTSRSGMFTIRLALSDESEVGWQPCRLSLSPFLASEIVVDNNANPMPTENTPQLYYLLYHMQTMKIKLFFRIPEVVFISDGMITSHFFTSKNGDILRKAASNMDSRDICRGFTNKTIDARYNFEKCVALVHNDPPHLMQLEQFQQMEKLLRSNEQGTTRANIDMVMQMYIKPKNDLGYESCVVRRGDALWVHNGTFRYSRRYRTTKPSAGRGSKDNGLEVFHPVPEAIANEIERLTALMMRYMWKVRTTIDVLTCEFVQDYSGKLFLHRMTTKIPEQAVVSLPP